MDEVRQSEERITTAPSYRVWLCGSFRLERRVGDAYTVLDTKEWGGHSSPRTVLKALLCTPRRRASRGSLLAQIWPEADGEQASRDLNVAISRLRKVLSAPDRSESLLLTEHDSLGFSLALQSALWVDVDAALALVKNAEQVGKHSPTALSWLEKASRSFQRGGFLENDDGEWATNKRVLVERGRYRCFLWLAEVYAQQGKFRQAEAMLNDLFEEDPTDEDVLGRLMQVLHQQGLTHQALVLYRQTSKLFAKEGMEFSASTRNLIAHLAQDRRSPAMEINIIGDSCSFSADSSLPLQQGIFTPFALPASSQTLAQNVRVEDEIPPFFSSLVSQRCDKASNSEPLQMPLQTALASLDTLAAQMDLEQYHMSRRQILVALAALPLTMLSLEHPRSDTSTAEMFLPQCAASLVACNHLIKSQDFWYVRHILMRLIPSLATITQCVSTYQVMAAHLLTQCYLLLGILESHQLNWPGYTSLNKHALRMSLLTPDKSLQVVAHVQLAMAFFHFEQPSQALSLYQSAEHLVSGSSPLVQSDFYVKQAVAYAQAGQVVKMHKCLEQAHTLFPKIPGNDPSSLFTDFGASSLLSWKATAQLQLAHKQLEIPGNVWKTLSEADLLPAHSSSKVLVYIQNLRAETALAMNDLERFASFLATGIAGAKQLRSARRFQEAVDCHRMAQKRWPRETRIQALDELFVEEHTELRRHV